MVSSCLYLRMWILSYGVLLSCCSASHCAGLIDVIVASISPQVLKQFSDELDYRKELFDIVRETITMEETACGNQTVLSVHHGLTRRRD